MKKQQSKVQPRDSGKHGSDQFRLRKHLDQYANIETMDQAFGQQAVIQIVVRLIAKRRSAQAGQHHVQHVEPDDVALVARHSVPPAA